MLCVMLHNNSTNSTAPLVAWQGSDKAFEVKGWTSQGGTLPPMYNYSDVF